VDIFTTKCRRLTLQYRHDQQGLSVISDPLSADVGQVLELRGTGDEESPMKLAPGDLPAFANLSLEQVGVDKIVIVVPIAVNITRVECS
jgi:hypothetical protein